MTEASPETTLLVAFARLEGKVDLSLSELNALKQADSDHEARIRSIEQQPIPDPETEKRIRTLEDRRTVTPGQLWAGLVGVLGVVAVTLTIINGVVGLLE